LHAYRGGPDTSYSEGITEYITSGALVLPETIVAELVSLPTSLTELNLKLQDPYLRLTAILNKPYYAKGEHCWQGCAGNRVMLKVCVVPFQVGWMLLLEW
jgi:hypothetical protein